MSSKMLHTCIRVKDLDKSLDFYTNVLGLKESRRLDFPEHQFTLVYLAFDNSDYELELTYNYDQETAYDLGNGYGHIAIGVDNIKELHEKSSSWFECHRFQRIAWFGIWLLFYYRSRWLQN